MIHLSSTRKWVLGGAGHACGHGPTATDNFLATRCKVKNAGPGQASSWLIKDNLNAML
jgi:hypothetical protein